CGRGAPIQRQIFSPFDAPLEPLQPGVYGPGRFEHNGVAYELVDQDGHFEVAAMSVSDPRHTALSGYRRAGG
ncbi:MAG TPA: hypothetical protein VLH85_02345, partial [Levilinea sp.]|nr:hypothetical protein [Levilinea sp.]